MAVVLHSAIKKRPKTLMKGKNVRRIEVQEWVWWKGELLLGMSPLTPAHDPEVEKLLAHGDSTRK